MKILPLLLVAYVAGIIMMRVGDPSSIWTSTEILWLNGGALVLGAIFFAALIHRSIHSVPEGYRISVIAALVMLAVVGYEFRADILAKTGVLTGGGAYASVLETDGQTAVERQWDGHFRASADVNGNPVDMLVDTGASVVLLTYEDAVAAGIAVDTLDFDVPILTANGRGYVASITLDEVSISGVSAKNIRGAIAQPGQLHASLLGMSFLGAIEEAAIRKDRLILTN